MNTLKYEVIYIITAQDTQSKNIFICIQHSLSIIEADIL